MAPLAVLTDTTLVASLQHHDCTQHESQAAFCDASGPTSPRGCPYSASSAAMHRLSSPKVLYLRRTTLSDTEPGPLRLLHRRATSVSMLGLTIGLTFAFVILGILGCWLLGKKSRGQKRKGSKKRGKRARIRRRSCHSTYEDTSTRDHRGRTRHHRSHNRVSHDWTFPYPETVLRDLGIWPSRPEPIHPAHEAPVPANDMDAPQDDTRDEPAYDGRYWMR